MHANDPIGESRSGVMGINGDSDDSVVSVESDGMARWNIGESDDPEDDISFAQPRCH